MRLVNRVGIVYFKYSTQKKIYILNQLVNLKTMI